MLLGLVFKTFFLLRCLYLALVSTAGRYLTVIKRKKEKHIQGTAQIFSIVLNCRKWAAG